MPYFPFSQLALIRHSELGFENKEGKKFSEVKFVGVFALCRISNLPRKWKIEKTIHYFLKFAKAPLICQRKHFSIFAQLKLEKVGKIL